jgi:hypothetical protein
VRELGADFDGSFLEGAVEAEGFGFGRANAIVVAVPDGGGVEDLAGALDDLEVGGGDGRVGVGIVLGVEGEGEGEREKETHG